MPPPDRPVLVVAAMPEEIAPLRKRLDLRGVERLDGHRVSRAVLGYRGDLLLAVTGDGATEAARVARRLCDFYRPTALVGIGAAGALTPSLAPRDVVASARLIDGLAPVPSPDSVLLSLATAAGAIPGTLVTTEAPVVSAAAKKALAENAGDIATVDMESAGWARAASEAGIPFVIARAVLDAADEELPGYLPDCVAPGGGIRRGAVLLRALRHPSSVRALVWMHRRLDACADRLADFLERFLV